MNEVINMKLMNVKGTYDYMPSDMRIRNDILDILRKNFERYGYLPIETPIVNYYELLSYKYSDDAEILSEIYRLTDQGERDLGLRYDLTVPFCKVVGLNKDLVLPFRRYEIGRVFRNGPVKAGRTRESSLQHFNDKLLLLKDKMNTQEAKRIAESRHLYMEEFLREFQKESKI